jgi:ATP-dependent exoDNAse (exonuclease V) beta subunit
VDPEKLAAEWQLSSPLSDKVKHDVCDQFLKAVDSPEIRKALSKPAIPQMSKQEGRARRSATAAVRLWLEKPFEVILDNTQLVGGIFDRVLIYDGLDGGPISAAILDYKSDRINNEEGLTYALRRHRAQLQLYRRALSQILRLDPAKISLQLLFTRPGRVLELE